MTTSKKNGKVASNLMKTSKSKAVRSVAASDLAQRRGHKRGK